MKYTTAVLLGLAVAGLNACAAELDLTKLPPASTQTGVTYAKDIKPLFDATCVQCHGAPKPGADARRGGPKGGLRLDTLEGILKGGEEGKVVVPSESAKSKLVISVAQLNPKTAMPPKPREGRGPGAAQRTPPKPLTAEEVGLVRAWIDQGAK
jgi:mono/diheme cytochrome c family protein